MSTSGKTGSVIFMSFCCVAVEGVVCANFVVRVRGTKPRMC